MIYIDPVTESDTWYNLIWNPCMAIPLCLHFFSCKNIVHGSDNVLHLLSPCCIYLFFVYLCAIMPMFLTYSHILNLWEWVHITNFTCLKWKFLNCTLLLIQAIDHIINSAAKSNYMSAGQISVPIVFRGPNGAAAGVGAQHSQVICRNLPLFGCFTAVDSLEYKLLRDII
jgi:hypothetical protein